MERRVLGPSGRELDPKQRIGFDTLPDQLVNRHLERGLHFNLLVVGETGMGKSSLLESLFQTEFPESTPHAHDAGEVSLEVHSHVLREGGVELNLTLASTVGFGDQLNRQNSMDSVIAYIEEQYDKYLQQELKISRDMWSYKDTRVHCCIFMLPPLGRSVHQLDLMCLSQLSKIVNVIPVIAKSDTITKKELQRYKRTVLEQLAAAEIETFEPLYAGPELTNHLPLAVTASRDFVEVAGERIRARVYPWGIVEIENEAHSDFVRLRQLLLRCEMEPLMRHTHTVFYEQFRFKRLVKMGFSDMDDEGNPVSWHDACEAKRKEHLAELSRKEDEMRQTFVQKVKEKEAQLKTAEQQLNTKFEKLRQIHLDEQNQLRTEYEQLESERAAWERMQQELNDKDHKHKKDKKKKKEKE